MRKFILYVILYVRSLMQKKSYKIQLARINIRIQNYQVPNHLSTSTLMADFCQDIHKLSLLYLVCI